MKRQTNPPSIKLIAGLWLLCVACPVMAEETAPTIQVNINTASEQELAYLPGVGPKTAAAIVKHRSKRPFRRAADIIRVRGIGRKTYRKLRPHLTTIGPTTARTKIRIVDNR